MGKIKGGQKPMYRCPENAANAHNGVRGECDYQAQGFLIYRILKGKATLGWCTQVRRSVYFSDEWRFGFSRKENKLYFFNSKTGESRFEASENVFNGFV